MELKSAEIFSVGKWNGLEFSDSDLEAIVRSFESLQLSGRVPLKLGHNDEQQMVDGQPALGWVGRIWKEGGKLLADFVNVPNVIYQAIRDKLYNFVSVELLQDAEQSGDKYPWVLSAVALLGSDRPAVSNLKELSKLVMSRRAAYQFSRAGTLNLKGDSDDMADDKVEAELAALKAKVQTFEDENKALKAERDKLVENGIKEKAAAIKSATEQKFETAIAAKTLLPAHRERFFKWTFPKTDEQIIEFDSSEADRYIEENKVAPPATTTGSKTRESEDGKTPDVRVAQRVRICMSENPGMSYKDAMVLVLRDDPVLGDEYRYMPDNMFK